MSGITQQPGKSVGESVASGFGGPVAAVRFRHCEHLIDAAADLIDAIFAKSASASVATSREVLGNTEEQVRLVRSLDSAAGLDSAAVRLFVERAQGIAAGFRDRRR